MAIQAASNQWKFKNYLLPSSGANLECLRPLAFLTTRTGLPPFQSLATAPVSLMAVLQFKANALKEVNTRSMFQEAIHM